MILFGLREEGGYGERHAQGIGGCNLGSEYFLHCDGVSVSQYTRVVLDFA